MKLSMNATNFSHNVTTPHYFYYTLMKFGD